MNYEFKINNNIDYGYDKYKKIDEKYYINYNGDYLTDVEVNDEKLICYGYCFDARNPEVTIKNTLENIIVRNSIREDIKYLNGHFILLYINDDQTLFMSDATSLTPIYINSDLNIISNNKDEIMKFDFFNSNLILNLKSRITSRITYDIDSESEEDKIIELLRYQHKYFLDKNIVVNYKNNDFMKALISIMKPVLYDNTLLDNGNSVDEQSSRVAKLIAKDFNMTYLTNEHDILANSIIYIRNQLFDISQIKDKSIEKSEYQVMLDSLFYELDDQEQITELSLLTRKRYQNKDLAKTGLLYDPFNVHAIYQVLLKRSNKQNNIIDYIIKELLPSINFYDMSIGSTLSQVNEELTIKNKELQKNQITAKNEQFLMDTKLSFFNVSNNLSGKVKNREILIYPAIQDIQAGEKFTITYENLGVGFIYIKSYYKNHKNGQSISVTIEGKKYTINELYNGLLFNVKNKLKITMQYKNARHSLPWQKAGTLLIRKE